MKTHINRLIYLARDLRSKELFIALSEHCQGDVLDVGGWEFFHTAYKKGIKFSSWTVIERYWKRLPATFSGEVQVILGDGCSIGLAADSYDTLLNIHVLEHVFEPIKMVNECARVLKPGGKAIFLIPQTATLHMAPENYANFTRFWIEEALRRANLDLIAIKTLGGVWSSMASHLVYFFLQSFRFAGMSTPQTRRNIFFYLLYPVMVVYALVSLPLTMLLSLGDLAEEPNNHLVVAQKKAGTIPGAAKSK